MKYLGEDTGKLGFGFMRLPEKPDGSPDYGPMREMVDVFLDEGFKYFQGVLLCISSDLLRSG
jgi:predicted aldo/keto reductase-like oxidoreductase